MIYSLFAISTTSEASKELSLMSHQTIERLRC